MSTISETRVLLWQKNADAQRRRLAAGLVFEKRPPSYRTGFWKLFCRLTKLLFWNVDTRCCLV